MGRAPAIADPTRSDGPKFGPGGSKANDLDDDNPNQYLQSAQSRQVFMQKLAGDMGPSFGQKSSASDAAPASAPSVSAPPLLPPTATVKKSHCLLMSNMFDPADPEIV